MATSENSSNGPQIDDDDAVLIERCDISDYNPSNVLPEPERVLDDLKSWLKPTKYDDEGSEYQKHLYSCLAGTGNWIYDTSTYKKWLMATDPGILWVRGIPGSGKSVLAASMAKNLSRGDHPMLFFFARHTVAANHTAKAALRDWLAQILKYSPPLQIYMKSYAGQKNDKGSSVENLSLAELFQLLRMALSHLAKVYIVIDALDEMEQSDIESFLHHFYDLSEWRPSQVKLLMTSRPVAVLEKHMRGTELFDIRLDKRVTGSDIAAYVQHRLASSRIPVTNRSIIADTVTESCDGLFLFARLAVDQAIEKRDQELDTIIGAIPVGLSVVYSNILEEQCSRTDIPVGLQQLVLKLVTHATRPLRLLEISELINVTQNMGDLAATKNLVRSVCGPLLEILPDETIHVIHHSLTEFLNGTTRGTYRSNYPIFEPGPTHNQLALLCISYLQSGCLDKVKVMNDQPYITERWLTTPYHELTPFTRYAGSNWHLHVQKASIAAYDQSQINRELHTLLKGDNLEKLGVLANANSECGFTPIGLATSLRLPSFAREVLGQSKANNKGPKANLESPLRHAVSSGDVEIVSLLLEHGADPKVCNDYGLSALHLAAVHGRYEVAKRLLDVGGIDPLVPKGPSQLAERRVMYDDKEPDKLTGTPVALAIEAGAAEIVSLFMPYIKTAKLASVAVFQAAEARKPDVLRCLIKYPGVDINYKVRYCTPLYAACANRDAASIEILLKAGADPNIKHDASGFPEPITIGYNVLHSLAGFGVSMPLDSHRTSNDEEIRQCFKLVLEAGASRDVVDHKGNTALHKARDAIAVECLLDAGFDPGCENRFKETLLHTTNDEGILKVLLPKLDVNARTNTYDSTPLLSTLQRMYGHKELKYKKASILLDHGADAAAVDNRGNGALHYLLKERDLGKDGIRLLRKLIRHGADINHRNKEGQTPLHLTSRYEYRSISKTLEELITAGTDVDIKDNDGRTALFRVISSSISNFAKNYTEVGERLIAAGADVNATDIHGRNLLHCLVQTYSSSAEFVRFLVSHGVNPHQIDNEENNLWHLAAPRFANKHPGSELLSELESLHVDLLSKNNKGETPLHIIAKFCPSAFRPDNSTTNGRPSNADDACFLDYFIGFYKDVDPVDNDGATPLHSTSTFSEYLTRKLLESGADIRKETREGLTPLHLACRSRATNALGVLLAWIKEKEMGLEVINAPDHLGRTPLWYGCASGRIETVKILLHAGATATTHSFDVSPWAGCLALQDQEDKKWYRKPSDSEWMTTEPDAAGVILSQTFRTRPKAQGNGFGSSNYPYANERLDEIIDLLITKGLACEIPFIDEAISRAVESKFDHAIECLLQVRTQLASTNGYVLNEETSLRLSKRTETPSMTSRNYGETLATVMIARRQYTLASQQIQQDVNVLLAQNKLHKDRSVHNNTIIHYLISNGFTKILDLAASPEAVHAIDIGASAFIATMLVKACQRESWNMDIVRLLVESKGADINAISPPQRHYGEKAGPRTLHILVRGGHWWQINEALPYLISKGADIEARDERGMTPLAAALEPIKGPHFSKRAVQFLLDAGADANSVDIWGRACSFYVGDNREIYQLLIRHGATVTHTEMDTVIKNQDLKFLQAMLESGFNPNGRKPGKETPRTTSADGQTFRTSPTDPEGPEEQYPLERTVASMREDKNNGVWEAMGRLLLDHGADPSARYQTTTVMHRLILHYKCNTRFLDIVLQSPKLDLESRDEDGLTPLLAACSRGRDIPRPDLSGESSLIKLLLKAGADAQAKDSKGRTSLHHLMLVDLLPLAPKTPDVDYIMKAAPELVHVVDNEGKTALQAAFNENMDARLLHDLIDAGADIHPRIQSTGDTLLHMLFKLYWIIVIDVQTQISHKTESGLALNEFGKQLKQNNLLTRLLAGGMDINARNNNGETPIFMFFREARIDSRMKQTGYGYQFNERDRVSVEKEHLIWQFLDGLGVDWKTVNDKGETLLHIVMAKDRGGSGLNPSRIVRRVKFLLEKGLDPMQEDTNHCTPLDVAAALEHNDVLELFKTS